MLSCIIDAMEGQDVATSDIPGDFLQNDYDKGDININMERENGDSTRGDLPILLQGLILYIYPRQKCIYE